MNDTKWDELRLAMYSLNQLAPRWRTYDVENGYVSNWDREWYYHFRQGGYRTIEWIEIEIVSDRQRELVLDRLRQVHVPGEASDRGFLVFGHLPSGQTVDYL